MVVLVLVLSGHQASGDEKTAPPATEKRADVVTIDALAGNAARELPPVSFQHDRHTKALAEAQKDCSSCHEPLAPDSAKGREGYLSFRYKGADALTGEALKTMYHESCIGCHAEMKRGPLAAECRTCHSARPVPHERRPMGFDKVLHYRHTASSQITVAGEEKNCASCHHVFDAATQKLVWGKNQEDSCRACHKTPEAQQAALAADPDAADENGLMKGRLTLDAAAHQSCVNCHRQITAQKLPDARSGPVECAGCHSAAALERASREYAQQAGTVPRLDRGQENAVLLLPVSGAKIELKSSMSPVSFNHKFHEGVTRDCRTCHHQKIAACTTCHTLEGKAEANFITLSMAMHARDSERSCTGCHNREKQKPSCAGCHSVAPVREPQASCSVCHSPPVGVSREQAESAALNSLDKETRTILALVSAAKRERRQMQRIPQEDIPETVSMGILSNEYQPSELPHRKIASTLLEKQKDSRLAAAFHADPATLCQGCHHNTPLSKTPPRCVSCHSLDTRSRMDGTLSLRAAYHQQCMTCHARMNQKPAETQCADCHKPRGN